MNSIRNIIRTIIAGETDRRLIVNTDSFFVRLFRESGTKEKLWLRMFYFVFVTAVLIASLVTIICSFAFFIDDVLLFRPQVRINRCGAFVPTNSCGREYVLFMFNSADVWADSGIQLCAGDRIKISASGAFNSTVEQSVAAARKNFRPAYPWYGSRLRTDSCNAAPSTNKHAQHGSAGKRGARNRSDENIADCMYNAPDTAYFGSILYQIQPDAMPCQHHYDPKTQNIHQLSDADGTTYREVRENGILHFAVNDIYLTPKIIERIDSANRKLGYADTTARTPEIDRLIHSGKLRLYTTVPGTDRICISGEKFRKYMECNADAWFRDNIGEILINVEIQRKLTHHQFRVHHIVDWYRQVEENAYKLCRKFTFRQLGQTLLSFVSLLWNPVVWPILLLTGIYAGIVFRNWFLEKFKQMRAFAIRMLSSLRRRKSGTPRQPE